MLHLKDLSHSLKILLVVGNIVAISFLLLISVMVRDLFKNGVNPDLLTSAAVTLNGTFERVHTDLKSTSRNTIVFVADGGTVYDASGLKVSPGIVGKRTSLSNAVVSGTKIQSASLVSAQAIFPRREPYLGSVTVSVVPFYFADSGSISGSASGDKTYVKNEFTQAAKYYEEASFGKVTLSMKIYDPVRIETSSNTPCDVNSWYKWIDQVKKKHPSSVFGAKITAFMFPRINGCDWEGQSLSESDTHSDYILIHGSAGYRFASHEFGHLVGSLDHAGLMKCGGKSIAKYTECQYAEKGDPFDVMSGTYTGIKPLHFNAAEKILGKYITGTQNVNFSGSREYRLDFVEDNVEANLGIVIPKQDTAEVYVLTYRKRFGFDDNTIIPSGGAAFLHILANPITEDQKKWSGRPTLLLDMTPGDNSFLNAYFTDGLLFCDPVNKISIKQVSHTTNYAILDIRNNSSCLSSNIVSGTPTPPDSTSPTPPPNVDLGGYVWDTNLKGVAGITMAVEGLGGAGYWKVYNPKTNTDGFYKQGGFIVYGGAYHVKADGVVKTLSDTRSRNTLTGQDTQQGNVAYMNQRADFNDCGNKSSFRCNFLSLRPIDTPSAVFDVTSFIWQPANPANKNKYSYRRTYLSTDGRTFYRKDCFFDILVEYPVICSGYKTGVVDTPGLVRGYSAFVFPGGGSKMMIRQSYVGTNGTTYYYRTCGWDPDKGEPISGSCQPFVTAQVTTPTAVRGVEIMFRSGYIYQAFISADGLKEYRRSCVFNITTYESTNCTGFSTSSLPAAMNGNSEFIYQGGFNNVTKVQQFFVGSDGRKPYFRTCVWIGSGSSAKANCPGFF